MRPASGDNAAGTFGKELAGTWATTGPDRARARLEGSVGEALKKAAQVASAGVQLWQLLSEFYQATGFPVSAREAQLKAVRPPECFGSWGNEGVLHGCH